MTCNDKYDDLDCGRKVREAKQMGGNTEYVFFGFLSLVVSAHVGHPSLARLSAWTLTIDQPSTRLPPTFHRICRRIGHLTIIRPHP